MLELLLPKNKLLKQIFTMWFVLSVVALACSGLYSFLPYALRTPAISDWLDLKHLFNVSLMIHVNLGVLVWFLSITSMLMCIVTKPNYSFFSYIAFFVAMIGAGFIICSPFVGTGEPIKNDYIPIFHNFAFILGIALFLSAVFLQAIITLLSISEIKSNLINFNIYISAVIFTIAAICFIQTINQLSDINYQMELLAYYEILFWGAGHVVQFSYIQLIIIVWMVIVNKVCANVVTNKNIFYLLQYLNILSLVPCIVVYFIYKVDSVELNQFFTLHMKYIGGLLTAIVFLWVIYNLFINRKTLVLSIEITTIATSVFLLFSGGVIGYLISGANVTIPAHYHGVILGITVGLMGLFYLLLPKMGFKRVATKTAILQMVLYSSGQFIHIIALAISGGYGVLRKAPGIELSLKAKIFMGAMGIGGTIALIGGIMFVILILRNMKVNLNDQKNI